MSNMSNITESNVSDQFTTDWVRPVNRIGIMTLIGAIAVSLLPNIFLYMQYGVFPPFSTALKAWSMILTAYVAFYFIEPFSYYPILGLTGTYMSFLTGNISNLRLPASAVAQEAVGVETSSKEAEIVSTLAISGSVLTNTILVTIAAIAGTAIISMCPPIIITGLTQFTLPAIFGAVFAQFAISNPKVAVISLPIPLILLGVLKGVPPYIVIAASVVGAIGISRIVYKTGKL